MRVAVVLAAMLIQCSALGAEPAVEKPFAYSGKEAVSFTVTAEGLSAIRLGEREVAKGHWRAVNADWINKASGKVQIGAILEKKLETIAADHARVRHVYKDAVVTFDYTFSGEDVAIKARVENNHETESLHVIGFQGLRFTWQSPPEGLMPCTHGSWLAAHPGQFFHPGMENKIGGTYGADQALGVGASPSNARLLRTITMWDYASWSPQAREKLPQRNIQYYVAGEIEPGQARTFGFKLRVSANTDWKHLLQPYKDYFTSLLGPVQYKADHRPILQMCVNKSVQYITRDNPYGFHDGWARLDLKQGIEQFCDKLIPLLKEVDGQGVIIWGQQGSEPRGAEYRPDFDVLPPEVEANWPTLKARFEQAGLKLGVCTRPDSIPLRINWTKDGLVDINPDDPGHLNMLWRRFKNMIDKGCTLFYMDCFGMRPEDVKIARFLREKMGPDIMTYSEMSCDAILPCTGLYMEVGYQEGKAAEDACSIVWLNRQRWAVMRWLVPGISTAVRPHGKAGVCYPWMLSHQMTPLEQPWALEAGKAKLKELMPRYMDAKGQWK